MKILMVNKFFYRKAGSEAYMFDLIDLLHEKGHQVIEFSMKDEKNQKSEYDKYFIDNIDFNKKEGVIKSIKKALHLLYSFETKHKLETLIKKEKPDIAHLQNFSFHLTPAMLSVFKKYKIPVVWTLHDYKLICPNYRLFTQGKACERCKVYKYYNCVRFKCIKNSATKSFLAMLEMYLHKILLRSYNNVDLFISPSKFLQDKISNEWQIPKDKTDHIYNFVNLDNFEPNYAPGDYLIYFGRLGPEKGIITLLKAIKDLPKIELKLIGEGPQRPVIEQYIKDNKINNVKLLGYKSGQELQDLIKNSRFVLIPSEWYENNPLVVLESFAFGKPVIGSKLGGIPELVKDGQTGFLFKPGDSEALKSIIKQNYSNIEIIEKLGKNARLFIEKNATGSVHYEQLIKRYKQIKG